MSSPLSHDDVTLLLAEKSAPARVKLAEKIAVIIEQPALSAQERAIAEDIARLLAQDVALVVRCALSNSLRRANCLPHDVALRLADDVEDVALPIISDSPLLNEVDLIALVRTGFPRKQVAVASRPDVTEPVADAVIESGAEPAVVALMDNAAARISTAGFGAALDRFSRSEAVKASMARRELLPGTVVERLVSLVSEQLQQYLVTHHNVPEEQATTIILQARDRVTLNLSKGCSEAELLALTAQMHQQGRLTPFLVWRALSLGDMAFFEAAMATLAGVPIENARILIHDAGTMGLPSLHEKSGLPPRLLPAIRAAVDVLREVTFDGGERDHERYRARVIARILTQFDDFPSEDLEYMLGKLGDVLTMAA